MSEPKFIRETPLLMRGPLVLASLEDRKTQTRRVMKPQPSSRFLSRGVVDVVPQWPVQDGVRWFMADGCSELVECPYGGPGSRLWIKENYYADCRESLKTDTNPAIIYAVSPELGRYKLDRDVHRCKHLDGTPCTRAEAECNLTGHRFQKLKPSIHMPRWASRLTLELTAVRVERVQDISERDAWAEGFHNPDGTNRDRPDRARYWFKTLWDSINVAPKPVKGKEGTVSHYVSYPWEDVQATRQHRGKPWMVCGNPWVWVLGYKRVAQGERIGA